jgi:hypothetical protein
MEAPIWGRIFVILWLGATALSFAFFLGAMCYVSWFRYDLIEKWAYEDKWAAPESYRQPFAKWFMRVMTLVGCFLFLSAVISFF